MTELGRLLEAPAAALLHLPPWLGYFLLGLLLTYMIGTAGWIIARSGRSPLWALLLLVPWVNVVAIWLFAYCRWPAANPAEAADEGPR